MIAFPPPTEAPHPPDRGVLRLACVASLVGIVSFVAASTLQMITSPAAAGLHLLWPLAAEGVLAADRCIPAGR